MTSAQVVETSVTNNSSFQNYPHPDDHTIRTIAWFPFLRKIFHQTQGMITKEMICFYVLPEKKESLDKDKSIKILTFSSQPHSPFFHVVNVKKSAVTNRKCVKLLTNQVVTRVTRRIFAVLSLLPSCCVWSLMMVLGPGPWGTLARLPVG